MKPEDKVYLAYFKSKKQELYFNQIKELTKLSDSSLTRTLGKLVTKKILLKNITKSNTFYKIQNKKIFTLKFSEIAVNKFDDLNRGVRIPLIEFLKYIKTPVHTIVLFGSSSIKQETKNSDIDILIVTNKKINFDSAKLKSELISNYLLNVFICNAKDFKKAGDHLIKQVKLTGFPIKGEQNYYEVLLDEY